MKMFLRVRILTSLLLMSGPTLFPAWASAEIANYMVMSATEDKFSVSIQRKLEALGGKITSLIPQIGIAVVSSGSPNFASQAETIEGVEAVIPDLLYEAEMPAIADLSSEPAQEFGYPPDSGDDDWALDFQWNLLAIDAIGAWNSGARGAGVRIAIVDSGIDKDHPEFLRDPNDPNSDSNVDEEKSTSFIPNEHWNPPPSSVPHHGTAMAFIAAGLDNGVGGIGVAPEAELVAVKTIFNDSTGFVSTTLKGIIYASDIDSDVINLSLGFPRIKNGNLVCSALNPNACVTAEQFQAVKTAYNRAISYAYRKGSIIFHAGGNLGRDLDHDPEVILIGVDSSQALAISATSPKDWGKHKETDLDVPASYSNYGKSAIDFAAPGGNFYPDVTGTCLVEPRPGQFVPIPCRNLDAILIPVWRGLFLHAVLAGTSNSVAHASGVAALIISAYGEKMNPGDVKEIMIQTADDILKPGRDEFSGHGRLNAARAVEYVEQNYSQIQPYTEE